MLGEGNPFPHPLRSRRGAEDKRPAGQVCQRQTGQASTGLRWPLPAGRGLQCCLEFLLVSSIGSGMSWVAIRIFFFLMLFTLGDFNSPGNLRVLSCGSKFSF